MSTDRSGVRVVRESFWHQENGYPEMVKAGATVREGHPLIAKFEEHFRPLDYVDFDVPTANIDSTNIDGVKRVSADKLRR